MVNRNSLRGVVIPAVMMSAKEIFENTKNEVREEIEKYKRENVTPGLAAVLCQDDETQKMFVSLKTGDCREVGIYSECHELYRYPESEIQDRLIRLIGRLNIRDDINGILIQKPLPTFIDEYKVFRGMNPEKDVDGLTPYNKGRLMSDYNFEKDLLPCTPVGICKLLDYYNVKIEGKMAVIVGRKDLVQRPLRILLESRNATPVCVHRMTKNKYELLKEADIIISAAGRPPEIYVEDSFRLTSDMIKQDAVVVGVGVRKDKRDGKLYFDLPDAKSEAFQKIRDKTSHLTPNLNGSGLMTRGNLMNNTMIAVKIQAKRLKDGQRGYPS